jgi:hypothetical protein
MSGLQWAHLSVPAGAVVLPLAQHQRQVYWLLLQARLAGWHALLAIAKQPLAPRLPG